MTDPEADAREADPEAEYEWRPVAGWPEEARSARRVIEDCDAVLPLLEGAADDFACHVAIDFVREVRAQHKTGLAMLLLQMHGIELPPRGEWRSPQERIQENLRTVADAVRSAGDGIRPEDVGMAAPPASRARTVPPGRHGSRGPLHPGS